MQNSLFDRKGEMYFGALSYLGYALLAIGLALGSSPWWWQGSDQVQMLSVGGLLVLLGILFKFTYQGFQINFKTRQVREYLAMFGLKTGKWAPLPAFRRVVLSSNLGPLDEEHAHGHDHEEPAPLVTWYTIGLYSQSEEPDYEFRTGNEEDALKTLHLLSEQLRVPAENLVSATSR